MTLPVMIFSVFTPVGVSHVNITAKLKRILSYTVGVLIALWLSHTRNHSDSRRVGSCEVS